VDSQQWLDQAPKVVDALKRGSPVSIVTWGGRELAGTICDREQTGLLLDVREPGDQCRRVRLSAVVQYRAGGDLGGIAEARQVLAELGAAWAVSRGVLDGAGWRSV